MTSKFWGYRIFNQKFSAQPNDPKNCVWNKWHFQICKVFSFHTPFSRSYWRICSKKSRVSKKKEDTKSRKQKIQNRREMKVLSDFSVNKFHRQEVCCRKRTTRETRGIREEPHGGKLNLPDQLICLHRLRVCGELVVDTWREKKSVLINMCSATIHWKNVMRLSIWGLGEEAI